MITGVILARNEQHNIVECIQALRPHVEEILLIDMESTDDTVERAQPLVDKILSHPLVAKFDAARNIAIPTASFDWLWFVDADERIPAATGRLARHIVATQGDHIEAVHIPFKSYFCGQWMQHCGWWPGYTMQRLMKRGYFRFSEKLHGGVEFNGRSTWVPPDPALGIDHFSYTNISHYLTKINNYTSTEAQQLDEDHIAWDWELATRMMTRELWNYYERNRGNLDGERGWILSWLSAQYRWLSHAKLIDLNSSANIPRAPNIPPDLDSVIGVMEDELALHRTKEPQLPLGVVFYSPLWDFSGYADEGRAIAKALCNLARPMQLRAIPWADSKCELPNADRTLLRALENGRRPKYSIAITNCIATLGPGSTG